MRFPEFHNIWEQKTIGDIFTFVNGKAHEQDVADAGKYIIVNSKYISTDGLVQKYSEKQMCPLYKNDIVMVMSDVPNGKAMSKCLLIDENDKYTLNQRICALRNIEFPLFFLAQINRNQYFMKFDDGVKQTNLRKDDVLLCPVYLTSKSEQKKIAEFLSLVNKRIEQQRKLVETLKRYKRGLLFDVFNKKIQFKNPNGVNFPKWESMTVSDVLNYEQPQKYIVASENYNDNYKTPVLTANKAFILGYTNENNGIYSKGEAIIYDDFTMDMKFATFNFKVKSSTIKILTCKESNDLYFMYNLLLSLNLKPQGHQRSYISILEPTKILVPCYEEQKLISNLLRKIDSNLERQTVYLDILENYKKGLLQQMFI